MNRFIFIAYWVTVSLRMPVSAQTEDTAARTGKKDFDPSALLGYDSRAKEWEETLPVGNGRSGAMVFGKYDEKRIHLNEETCWSGGPYSTVLNFLKQCLPLREK